MGFAPGISPPPSLPPTAIDTPAVEAGNGSFAGNSSFAGNASYVAATPLVDEGDLSEISAENRRRKVAALRLKGALQQRGGRVTTG